MNRLPVAAPDLGGNEEAYAIDAIRSSWISSTGKYVDRFEADFAGTCGTRAAVAVVNGTAALHLAMLALGVGPGDEVIVPSLTYIATANAVTYCGASPVFADIDSATWCINPAAVAELISSRTKGIIAVHLYGHPADMDALDALAKEHGLWVVEDAAEAVGATYKGRPTGGLGRIGVFSFYGNKIVTSGEGGAVTLNDTQLESSIRRFRGQGMDPERRYYFPSVGYNYRMTNVACAILCAQLERRGAITQARARVFEGYTHRLTSVPGIGLQPVAEWADPAPWLFCITVDEDQFGVSRDDLAAMLDNAGIETRPFFPPVHEMPPYRRAKRGDLTVTSRVAATGMNLPTAVRLADSDLDRVVGSIIDARPR